MPNRATPGQPLKIPARDWNGLMDMLRGEQNRHKGGAGKPSGLLIDNTGIVWVKNATGQTLERLSVLGIDGPVFEPNIGTDTAAVQDAKLVTFKNDVILNGVEPSSDDHARRFVVLKDPLEPGAIGRGYISGVCMVQIDVLNASDEFADIADGDTSQLRSGSTGAAQILWHEDGNSDPIDPDGEGEETERIPLWAIVRLGTGDSFLKFVWLTSTGDGVYSAYAKGDPDKEGTPVGVTLQPIAQRNLGTIVDFTQYAETGFGYYNAAGTFVLWIANEEQYATRPCVETPP